MVVMIKITLVMVMMMILIKVTQSDGGDDGQMILQYYCILDFIK